MTTPSNDKGGFRIHTLRSINEPHLILCRLPSRIAYTHRLNPQITEFTFLENQPTSTGCCFLRSLRCTIPPVRLKNNESWSRCPNFTTIRRLTRENEPISHDCAILTGFSKKPQIHYNRFQSKTPTILSPRCDLHRKTHNKQPRNTTHSNPSFTERLKTS